MTPYSVARAASMAFYGFMLAWTRLDIRIARSTGQNMDNIMQLLRDEDEYERMLTRWELEL